MQSQTHQVFFAGVVMALGLSASVSAQYVELGPGRATGISHNGRVVAGDNGAGVFRWTGEGMWQMGANQSAAPGGAISADGTKITGNDYTGQQVATVWTLGSGWQSIGGLPGGGCGSLSSGYALSADGLTAVGLGWEGCRGRAYKWTQATGMVNLGVLGPNSSRANCASGDGSIVGGWDTHPTGARRAALWYPNGTEVLLVPSSPTNPNQAGEVWDVNSDGSVVVGESYPNAFKWTTANGFEDLGPLPGAVAGDIGIAWATTEDGSMIVGNSGSFFTGYNSFMWTKEDGMMRLDFYLAQQGIDVPPTTVLGGTLDITPDGTSLVGFTGTLFADKAYKVDMFAGQKYGFLNTPSSHIMDLSGSGNSRIGTIFTVTTENVPGANTLTVFGVDSSSFPVAGGEILVSLANATVVSVGTVGGATSLPLPIPDEPLIVGAKLFLQSISVDGTQSGGLAFSNGLEFTIRD